MCHCLVFSFFSTPIRLTTSLRSPGQEEIQFHIFLMVCFSGAVLQAVKFGPQSWQSRPGWPMAGRWGGQSRPRVTPLLANPSSPKGFLKFSSGCGWQQRYPKPMNLPAGDPATLRPPAGIWSLCHLIHCPPASGAGHNPALSLLLKIRGDLHPWEPGCSCSATQLWPALPDPMDRSTPGSSAFHYLPESAQVHVPWVGDAV